MSDDELFEDFPFTRDAVRSSERSPGGGIHPTPDDELLRMLVALSDGWIDSGSGPGWSRPRHREEPGE